MPTRSQSTHGVVGLALPSKGRMEDEMRAFLRECGLSVNKVNPRQYIAEIPEFPKLGGLQGPTISQVYLRETTDMGWYAITMVVQEKQRRESIEQLRTNDGSAVLVLPTTYIFEEEPPRWYALLQTLGIKDKL